MYETLDYQPIYFKPVEFIPPSIYALCGDDALNMMDYQILKAADELRKEFGPMICNTWWSPKLIKKYGLHRFRGIRPKNCKIGAKRSCHKVGLLRRPRRISAVDLWPARNTAKNIRKKIKENQDHWMHFFSRVENRVSWLHVDTAPNPKSKIKFFNP